MDFACEVAAEDPDFAGGEAVAGDGVFDEGEAEGGDVDAGFFAGFTDDGLPEGFVVFEASARADEECGAVFRGVADEEDFFVFEDECSGGDAMGFGHGCGFSLWQNSL